MKRNIRTEKVAKLLRAIHKLNPTVKILDIGCRDGIFTSEFSKTNNVFGMDMDMKSLIKAKANGLRAALTDAGRGLPYKSSSFDLIFAGEVIEHVVDTDLFLKEVNRVLKPGGILLLTTPNLSSLENRIRLLFGRYPLFIDYCITDDNHVRAYTHRAIREQLQKHHFSIDILTGSFVPVMYAYLKRQTRFSGLLGALFPGLATHRIVKAVKHEAIENMGKEK